MFGCPQAHSIRERCDAGIMSQELRNVFVEYRWEAIEFRELESRTIKVAKQLELCEEFNIDYESHYKRIK